MEIISYNHELEYANLLFSKLFRNIKINKFYKNTLTEVQVDCRIGNRWRIFKNMENPEKLAMYKFPMIVISRRGLQVEPDRIANLHNEIKWFSKPDNPYYYDLMTPVPVAISYDVTIISKDQGTNDMIMSNFIPFFNQDLFVSSIHPKFTNVRFNNQVIMGNNITEEHPDELANTDDDFVINTCNFTYKTYLFGGKDKVKAGSNGGPDDGGDDPGGGDDIYDGFVPIIKSIMLDMHAVPFKDPFSRTRGRVSCIIKKPTSCFCEPSCTCGTACSCEGKQHFKELSVYRDSADYDPYFAYSVEKYFRDVDAGLLPSDVDTLRWYIDDGISGTNKFKLDRFTKFDTTGALSTLSGLARASALYNLGDKVSVDYPGEMWQYGMDPLSGFRNVGLSSVYVPINKPNETVSCECGCQYFMY